MNSTKLTGKHGLQQNEPRLSSEVCTTQSCCCLEGQHNICQAALLCLSGNFLFEVMVFVKICLDFASPVTSLKAGMLGLHG